jgi:hypothetical protein
MSNAIKIVGLDPSLSNFGITHATLDIDTLEVTVDSFGLTKTTNEKSKAVKKVVRKNSEDLDRAQLLHEGLLEACKGRSLAFVEMPVGSQSSRAMASYGICLGVLAACPIPMIQVTPTEVKVAGTGIKTATKEEMIEAAIEQFPNAPWPMKKVGGVQSPIASQCEHLADASFAIKAGLKTDQFLSIRSMFRMLKVA